MFTAQDKAQLESIKLSIPEVESQIDVFKTGLPNLEIEAPATIEDGILQLTNSEIEEYAKTYDSRLEAGLKPVKFVPASGAATRMFKALFSFLESGEISSDVDSFTKNIEQFAFASELLAKSESDKPHKIIETLISKKGLNYGQLPKGLLKFHTYKNETRTPFEEHMVEGVNYCKRKNGEVHLHFTVSPAHQELFEELFNKLQTKFAANNIQFKIDFSEQDPSTDTIAVDENNEPIREDGKLLFRPGGHGALIENLNKLKDDLIFIKNIDNVVPDHRKDKVTTQYKKALAGLLLTHQKELYRFQKIINEKHYSAIKSADLADMVNFIQDKLMVKFPKDIYYLEKNELVPLLKMYINRPIRVCGMVKNEGEPGGGPFWVKQSDGAVGLQIVEASQINKDCKNQQKLMQQATHFNPVDLVCAPRNYNNKKFDLNKFIDHKTAFISRKTHNGTALKALERPGLWNGAMSFWSTIFVEVPSESFAPVKSVNDLLRPEHQPLK